jgi:hypothetical protein
MYDDILSTHDKLLINIKKNEFIKTNLFHLFHQISFEEKNEDPKIFSYFSFCRQR